MNITVSAIGFSHIKSTKFIWLTEQGAPAEVVERGIKHDRQWLVVEGSMFVAQRQGTLPVPLPQVCVDVLYYAKANNIFGRIRLSCVA